MPQRTRIRNEQIDNYMISMVENSSVKDKMQLSPQEVKMLHRPASLVSAELDRRLVIATKLHHRIYIVGVREDGLSEKEFIKLFRHPFHEEEKNSKIASLAYDKMLFVIGNETVARWLHKAELFLSSDLYSVTRTIRRLQKKTGQKVYIQPDTEFEEHESFIHHALRSYIASQKIEPYLESMALNYKEFVFLSILYISGKPIANVEAEKIFHRMVGTAWNIRKIAMSLNRNNYIQRMQIGTTHAHKKKMGNYCWALTDAGHEAIIQIVNKIKNETMERMYE